MLLSIRTRFPDFSEGLFVFICPASGHINDGQIEMLRI